MIQDDSNDALLAWNAFEFSFFVGNNFLYKACQVYSIC